MSCEQAGQFTDAQVRTEAERLLLDLADRTGSDIARRLAAAAWHGAPGREPNDDDDALREMLRLIATGAATTIPKAARKVKAAGYSRSESTWRTLARKAHKDERFMAPNSFGTHQSLRD